MFAGYDVRAAICSGVYDAGTFCGPFAEMPGLAVERTWEKGKIKGLKVSPDSFNPLFSN